MVVDFSANRTSADANSTITFTDLTTDDPTGWLWDLGDTNTSTARNPVHTYLYPGVYTVSLTAYKGIDDGTETKVEYIHINLVGIVSKYLYISVATAAYTLDIAPPPAHRIMYQTGPASYSFATKGVRTYIGETDSTSGGGFSRERGPSIVFD